MFLSHPLILALALSSIHRQQSMATPLDVMTFNIRYGTADDGENRWEVRKPRTIQALRRRLPTIFGLQEALADQIDDLTRAMLGYAAVGVGRDDVKAAGEFSAILYDRQRLHLLRSDTFWLSDTPTVPGSKHWGNNVVRVCTWAYFRDLKSGRYFYHFNTHLDHQSQPSREKSTALILKRITERGTNDPVIITGDFNVGESNPVVAAMKENSYRDSFRIKHPDAKNVGTFNGWQKTVGTDKIDYVFVGPGIDVQQAEIVMDRVEDHWISDHVPVVATLRMP